jgi:hypothetical protein
VFKEVAGAGAYYFEGLQGKGLADAISRWLDLYSQNQSPTSENLQWLTWNESAKKLCKRLQGISLKI